jgi:hypothetical protein
MGERKMEFEAEAGPVSYGPTSFSSADERHVRTLLEIVQETMAATERAEVSNAVQGLSMIMHDLDEDCGCDTCTEVREIRAQHGN